MQHVGIEGTGAGRRAAVAFTGGGFHEGPAEGDFVFAAHDGAVPGWGEDYGAVFFGRCGVVWGHGVDNMCMLRVCCCLFVCAPY